MDIDTPVLLWVTTVKADSRSPQLKILKGRAVAGTHGFGRAGERSFHGHMSCLSQKAKWSGTNVSVSEGHMANGGFFWSLRAEEHPMLHNPPYFLTNHLSLRLVGCFDIRFEPATEWDELETKDGRTETYLLVNPAYLAILTVDKSKSNRSGSMLVYSDQEIAVPRPGQVLRFAENTNEEFGNVVEVSNQHRL